MKTSFLDGKVLLYTVNSHMSSYRKLKYFGGVASLLVYGKNQQLPWSQASHHVWCAWYSCLCICPQDYYSQGVRSDNQCGRLNKFFVLPVLKES